MYEYEISGYYFAGEERKHFSELVKAVSNTVAMDMVVGRIAREVSREEKTFRLEFIHYEVL